MNNWTLFSSVLTFLLVTCILNSGGRPVERYRRERYHEKIQQDLNEELHRQRLRCNILEHQKELLEEDNRLLNDMLMYKDIAIKSLREQLNRKEEGNENIRRNA